MRRNSSRIATGIVLACVLLALGILGIVLYTRAHTVTVAWQAGSSSFLSSDQQAIESALSTALAAQSANTAHGYQFAVIYAERQDDWAVLSASPLDSAGGLAPGEPLFVLARQQATTWMVWLSDSPQLCAQLHQAPDTLIQPLDRAYFLGC